MRHEANVKSSGKAGLWIKLFSKWGKTPSVSPNAPASTRLNPGLTDCEGIAKTPKRFGLDTLHEPLNNEATGAVNVIFVHGLGGSPASTWKHALGFWPTWFHEWLAEKGIRNIRIATFGYNADYRDVLAPRTGLGIADFAQQLLDGIDLYYGNVNVSLGK
jgi:hypothetical protein